MSKTLAYILFTVMSPAEYAGQQFITESPVVCETYLDWALPKLEESGFEMMAQCQYTAAPVTSPRPQPRSN